MKDSGIEWISQIPRTWQMVPNYAVMSEVKNIVGNNADEYTLLSLTKQGVIVRDLDAGGKFPTSFDAYKAVVPGQIIFCLFDIDETPRTVGIVNNRGMITGAYDVFDVKKDVCDGRFLLYYYLVVDDGKHLRPYYASLRKTVTPTAFRHIKMPLPPLHEQHLIADYLDERCGVIDKVKQTLADEIEALQRLRKATIHKAVTKGLDERAPMRDSGVEWIGEVPSAWETPRFKTVYRQIKRVGYENEELLSVYLNFGVIRFSDDDGVRVHKTSSDTSGYQLVTPGDLVMNNQQAWRGSVGVSALRGIISPAYHVYESIHNGMVNDIYANYMFRSCMVPAYELCSHGVGTIQRNISPDEFGYEVIPLPPLAEQQRIADYLDERCAAIDSVIDTRTRQLERLEDYRKALIFAYVTGKKEVPSHE